jgi:hypothetical protein
VIPASALIKARHVTITAELVRFVGGMNEAAVASLISWKTEPNAPYATDDGWWPATADDLSDWTGLSTDQVRRALKKLLDEGHIEREKLRLGGVSDQTYSYRLVRQVDVAESPHDVAESPHPIDVAESPHLPLYETTDTYPSIDLFDVFWEKYPKKVGKADARKAWAKATKTTLPADIIAGLERLLPGFSPDLGFVKGPEAWLNGKRWEDELVPRVQSAERGGKQARPPIPMEDEWKYR